MKRLLIGLMLLLILPVALAPNNPGHDELYVEQVGDSEVTGSINISNELQVANLIYSSYLDVLGNGSNPANSRAEIYATSGNALHINAPGNIFLSSGDGSMVYVGTSAVDLNVSQNLYVTGKINNSDNIYINDTAVQLRVSGTCGAGQAVQTITAAGGVTCISTSGSSSGGGWSNTSTTTTTALSVNITNSSGYEVLLINTTARTVQYNGSTVCTPANGLCNQTTGSGDGGGWTNTSTTTTTPLHVNVTNSSGTEVLWVNTTARTVGIGTANPTAKLDVRTTSGAGLLIQTNETGTIDNLLTLSNTNGGGNAVGLEFQVGGSSIGNIYTFTDSLNIETDYGVHFRTSAAAHSVIEQTGKWGANTTNPNKTLQISAGAQSFTVDPLPTGNVVLNSTGSANVTITSSGGSVIVQLG